MKTRHFLTIACLAALCACSNGGKQWTLEGQVPDSLKVVKLEAPSPSGGWYVADSAKVKSGKFKIHRPDAGSTIYRLVAGEKQLYVPADSTETIKLGPDWTLSGSPQAELFNKIDATIASSANDATLKRQLLETLNGNFSTNAAYYVVKKRMANGLPLLNPTAGGADLAILRAVTNAFNNDRPNDARTAVLKSDLEKVNAARNKAQGVKGEQKVIYAPEISYYDISLMDRNGQQQTLSSVVNTHPVTLLTFVNLASEGAPAVNMAIGEAINNNPGMGVYQVGFGSNQHQWAGAVANLPWVNVFQSESATQEHLGQYMVTQLPTAFLIINGEIKARIDNLEELQSTITKNK